MTSLQLEEEVLLLDLDPVLLPELGRRRLRRGLLHAAEGDDVDGSLAHFGSLVVGDGGSGAFPLHCLDGFSVDLSHGEFGILTLIKTKLSFNFAFQQHEQGSYTFCLCEKRGK